MQLIEHIQNSLTKPALVAGAALVCGVMITGCASAPPTTPPSTPVPARFSVGQANDVTVAAIGLVGTPYRYGGNTPDSGFDCSGLIGYVYKTRANVLPPRSVSALVKWGSPVPSGNVRTGDLVIFLYGGNATHAGIYVGDGRFVHAPSSGGEVRLDQLKSKYWSQQQVAFRRP